MTGTEKDHFFILFYTSINVCMMGHRHHYSKKIYFVFDTLFLYFVIYHYKYVHWVSRTFVVRKVSGKGFCWSFGAWHIGHPVIARQWDVSTMRRLNDKTTMRRRWDDDKKDEPIGVVVKLLREDVADPATGQIVVTSTTVDIKADDTWEVAWEKMSSAGWKKEKSRSGNLYWMVPGGNWHWSLLFFRSLQLQS